MLRPSRRQAGPPKVLQQPRQRQQRLKRQRSQRQPQQRRLQQQLQQAPLLRTSWHLASLHACRSPTVQWARWLSPVPSRRQRWKRTRRQRQRRRRQPRRKQRLWLQPRRRSIREPSLQLPRFGSPSRTSRRQRTSSRSCGETAESGCQRAGSTRAGCRSPGCVCKRMVPRIAGPTEPSWLCRWWGPSRTSESPKGWTSLPRTCRQPGPARLAAGWSWWPGSGFRGSP